MNSADPMSIRDLDVIAHPASSLVWEFEPRAHGAIESLYLSSLERGSAWAIRALDDVVLDTRAQAAIRATKVFKQLLGEQPQASERVHEFMQTLAQQIQETPGASDPILPPPTLWQDR